MTMGKIILALCEPDSGEGLIDDMDLDFVLPIGTKTSDVEIGDKFMEFEVQKHWFDVDNNTLHCVAYPIIEGFNKNKL